MRDFDLEKKMATEQVAGITAAELRAEMVKVFQNKEYIPSIYPELSDPEVIKENSLFATMLDTACFAAMCSIRRANGLPVPELDAEQVAA